MNIASIDIGTNTVLLLIASINEDGVVKPLLNVYRVPRIGKNVLNGTPILNEKIDELVDILSEYKLLIEEYQCTRVFAYATNALRIASNSQFVVDKVKHEVGINIEIISGLDEARYGFLGAVSGVNDLEKLAVIDIGGGSTEIILGNKLGNFNFKHSFPIGVVLLTEQFKIDDNPSDDLIEKVNNFLRQVFSPLKQLDFSISTISAIGGTPTSLYCIKNDLNAFDEKTIEGKNLSKTDLFALNKYLIKTSPSELLDRFEQIVRGREDLLIAGSLILNTVVDLVNCAMVRVTTRGLRYGIVCDYSFRTFGKYSVE